MSLNFDKHAQKGNKFLNELARELGEDANKRQAGKILRAVFKTLRDYLPLAENFQLLSQLPMALKGVYVDTWMPTHLVEHGKKKIDFIEEVISQKDKNKMPKVEDIEETLREVRAVFRALKKYVSEGEFRNIEAILPKQLKDLLRSGIYANRITIKKVTEKAI